jgi:hypothetical protein
MYGTFREYVRCVCFLYYFVYVNVFLIALYVLSPSDNSIAVSDDDDNNNNNKHDQLNLFGLTTATCKLYFHPVQSNHFLNQQRKQQTGFTVQKA